MKKKLLILASLVLLITVLATGCRKELYKGSAPSTEYQKTEKRVEEKAEEEKTSAENVDEYDEGDVLFVDNVTDLLTSLGDDVVLWFDSFSAMSGDVLSPLNLPGFQEAQSKALALCQEYAELTKSYKAKDSLLPGWKITGADAQRVMDLLFAETEEYWGHWGNDSVDAEVFASDSQAWLDNIEQLAGYMTEPNDFYTLKSYSWNVGKKNANQDTAYSDNSKELIVEAEKETEEAKELESLKGMVFASEEAYTETTGFYAIAGPQDMISYVIFTGDDEAPIMIARKHADLSYSDVADNLDQESIEGTRRPYTSTISEKDGQYSVEINYTDLISKEKKKYSFDFYINANGPEYGISVSNVVTDDEAPEIWDGHFLVAQ